MLVMLCRTPHVIKSQNSIHMLLNASHIVTDGDLCSTDPHFSGRTLQPVPLSSQHLSPSPLLDPPSVTPTIRGGTFLVLSAVPLVVLFLLLAASWLQTILLWLHLVLLALHMLSYMYS